MHKIAHIEGLLHAISRLHFAMVLRANFDLPDHETPDMPPHAKYRTSDVYTC